MRSRGVNNPVVLWFASPERLEALEGWDRNGRQGAFEQSMYFAHARMAFRRRVNCSPEGETT